MTQGRVRSLSWTDTRDMVADGLTKGTVGRELLDLVCSGYRKFAHEPKKVELSGTRLVRQSEDQVELNLFTQRVSAPETSPSQAETPDNLNAGRPERRATTLPAYAFPFQ